MAEASAQQQVQEKWPSWVWALNIPEVGDILRDTSITDQTQLESKIEATNWYKTTGQPARQWLAEKQTDPGTAESDIGKKAADVNDIFQSLGLNGDPQVQSDLAQQALQFGWTSSQLNDAVVQYSRTHPAAMGASGSLQTSAAQLKQAARGYLVPLDDGTASSWASQIAAGEKKPEDFTALLQSQAMNRFQGSPEMVNALKNGQTSSDYLSNYSSQIAKMLNLGGPSEIDYLDNPLYSKILNYNDPKTGQARLMNFGEMENYIRSTPQYDHTPGAIQQAAQIGQGILQTFGKVA